MPLVQVREKRRAAPTSRAERDGAGVRACDTESVRQKIPAERPETTDGCARGDEHGHEVHENRRQIEPGAADGGEDDGEGQTLRIKREPEEAEAQCGTKADKGIKTHHAE